MATVTIRLDGYVVPVAGECIDCGFDALRRVRVYHLGATGVTTHADKTFCGRCRAEEKRASQ